MKPREYCCCAIPIINAGIYTTLATQENPTLFRRYVTLHILVSSAAFAVAAAWAIVSAIRHTTSRVNCLNNFFPDDSQSTLGEKLCEIIPWVDIGIMGGLWVILAIFQLYLFVVLSSYSSGQSRDHEKYDQLNNDNIPMNPRNDPWDSRPSAETPRSPQGYTHGRNESTLSTADVLAQPQLQPKDSISYYHSDYQYQPSREASRGSAGGQTHNL
ncbi:hypothetical protein C0993_008538 [Termitomyces sp. T159_Od127]|nr:hypothetical protein C0993_008538 [Termitomyces sp. T159_Od127]